MGRGLILETTFLIDLERELTHATSGPAQEFLDAHADDPLFITFTVSGELAAVMPPDARDQWQDFVAPFETLLCSEDVCWKYGQTFRYLRANGLLIGANDLWIAATALAFEKRVVTRNAAEYRRVPGLEVLTY